MLPKITVGQKFATRLGESLKDGRDEEGVGGLEVSGHVVHDREDTVVHLEQDQCE